jgi:hypothetical protein
VPDDGADAARNTLIQQEAVVEALVPMTMFVCIAAVLVLRPISKRLGGLIEAATRERTQARHDDTNNARVMLLLEQTARRIELIEERLDFTERLVLGREGGEGRRLPRRAAPRLDSRLDPAAEERLDIGRVG